MSKKILSFQEAKEKKEEAESRKKMMDDIDSRLKNLAKTDPEKSKELKEKLMKWAQEMIENQTQK